MQLDPDDEPRRCLSCGSHVSPDFARVHGDEEGRVHRCGECDSYVNIIAGSAAGLEELIDDHRREIANDRYCEPIPTGDGLLAGGVADE